MAKDRLKVSVERDGSRRYAAGESPAATQILVHRAIHVAVTYRGYNCGTLAYVYCSWSLVLEQPLVSY